MSDEGIEIKMSDEMIKVRTYADEFWGELTNLLEDKYGFTINDIVFSDELTHCEYCGGELSEKQRRKLSRFTNEFGDFCFAVGRRRLEVEIQSSCQKVNEE